MAKVCCNCHAKIGFRSGIELPDWNYLCEKCYMAIPPHMRDNIEYINAGNYKSCIDYWDNRFAEYYPVFHPEGGEPGYIEIDRANELFRVPVQNEMSEIFKINEIVDFNFCEDGESMRNNGIGRAVIGGMVAGGAGAVVGGMTGKVSKTVQNMYVLIMLNNPWIKTINIHLIDYPVKTTDSMYQDAKNIGNRIVTILKSITSSENSDVKSVKIPTEQLFDLKKLLDAGIITDEEFNEKKKQLLNII